jgi:hypothetical protein
MIPYKHPTPLTILDKWVNLDHEDSCMLRRHEIRAILEDYDGMRKILENLST